MMTVMQINGNGNPLLVIGGVVLFLILFITVWWSIFSKAGYSGALSLLMFIPVVNIILLLILAFGEWPIQREIRLLRERSR